MKLRSADLISVMHEKAVDGAIPSALFQKLFEKYYKVIAKYSIAQNESFL